MAKLETWFPLAVYYEDLQPDPETKARMLAYLEPWIAAHEADAREPVAWTGDRRGCWQIHREPAFDWLRREVERHVIEYARVLGVNLAVTGFYFQRSWPVLARPDEQVPRHAHANASISAVYYLKTPADADASGRLYFHNQAEQNALGNGFGLHDTRGIATWNELNYRDVGYPPVEDRLVLFPARQVHSVAANQSSELRISLSFDVAVTCSRHADPGQHEFLIPPPGEWTEFAPSGGGRGA
jgi:uncharacterized protein (TIGR02466 family)